MVAAAERYRELVADLMSESARSGKEQVVGIAGHSTTHQAGLLRHIPDVFTIANATRLRNRQCGFIQHFCSAELFLRRPGAQFPRRLGGMSL
jgi:hypothetical protein